MKVYTYKPEGVCTSTMRIATENGIIKNVSFEDGCDGNLQGLARLLEGASIDETVSRLKGIRCGSKQTSCPDQLAKALENIEKV